MTKSKEARWTKFQELAAASETVRMALYRSDGDAFVTELVRDFTVNGDLTDIRSAEDFSERITTLRSDYRECNQHLMSLMASAYAGQEQRHHFEKFIANCIWVDLVEAAKNFDHSAR